MWIEMLIKKLLGCIQSIQLRLYGHDVKNESGRETV